MPEKGEHKMSLHLKGKHFLKLLDFTPEEITGLLDLAAEFKAKKKAGIPHALCAGKNIALIFEKTSTRTRCSFEVAAHDLGMNTTYLDPTGSQIGKKESIADTARVLGIPAERQALISASGNELDSDEARNAKLLLWPGCCPIHESLMKPDMVDAFHSHFPGCRVLVHPECTPDVVQRCDGAGSTAYLIKEVEKAAAEGREHTLCIGTEFHLVHRLMERYAGKLNIIPLAQASCADMEKVDAQKLLSTLEHLEEGAGTVTVEESLKAPARDAIVRMLERCR